MRVDPGNQNLRHGIPKFVLLWLAPHPLVMRHDDHKGGRFPFRDQLIRGLVGAQAVPLILIKTLPVDQVNNRVATHDILEITGRQIDAEN
jgi:hypothetical protein